MEGGGGRRREKRKAVRRKRGGGIEQDSETFSERIKRQRNERHRDAKRELKVETEREGAQDSRALVYTGC